MAKTVVALHELRSALPIPGARGDPHGTLADTRGRPLRDLRISVTDRCNFRCVYCMPREVFDANYAFLPHGELLSFEEIVRLARAFHAQGMEKVRLTGGEPLLRKDIDRLVAMLRQALPGVDLTLTTNGSALKAQARALAAAGLDRLTVSLDSLDDDTFRAMNDADFPVAKVLAAIDAAAEAGLAPIKVNMVVKRGMNDQQVVDMARHFRGSGHIARFIEYMDVGSTNGWRMDDVVSSAEIVGRIHERFPLEPVDAQYAGEVAQRWRYADGAGEIGIITSVTQPFCRSCTRARISASGELYLCLFASKGFDLRRLMRDGASDQEIANALRSTWRARDDRYSELRSEETPSMPKVEMSHIGG